MVMLYPYLPLVAIMEQSRMSFPCSTFATKCFPGRLFTCYSIWPRLLQLILACYELALAMFSFINIPYCCMYACFVMHCLVMSESSSERCLHDSVTAMLCFLLSLKPVNETCYVYMGAIISSMPFWLMISKGLLFYAFSRFMPCLCLPC